MTIIGTDSSKIDPIQTSELILGGGESFKVNIGPGQHTVY